MAILDLSLRYPGDDVVTNIVCFRSIAFPRRNDDANKEVKAAAIRGLKEKPEMETSAAPRDLVAVREMRLWQGPRLLRLEAADDRLTAGFHAYEPVAAIRWTDGDAALPPDVLAVMPTGLRWR